TGSAKEPRSRASTFSMYVSPARAGKLKTSACRLNSPFTVTGGVSACGDASGSAPPPGWAPTSGAVPAAARTPVRAPPARNPRGDLQGGAGPRGNNHLLLPLPRSRVAAEVPAGEGEARLRAPLRARGERRLQPGTRGERHAIDVVLVDAAIIAHPLLKFDEVLAVRRRREAEQRVSRAVVHRPDHLPPLRIADADP